MHLAWRDVVQVLCSVLLVLVGLVVKWSTDELFVIQAQQLVLLQDNAMLKATTKHMETEAATEAHMREAQGTAIRDQLNTLQQLLVHSLEEPRVHLNNKEP